jgi:hypothetical protein
VANVEGTRNLVIKSPMGDQAVTLTVLSSGSTFTGTCTGAMGTTAVQDGKVDGSTLTWKMNITVPMPMTVDCEATVSGDTMSGTATAGAFGSFPLIGTRG